MQAALMLSVLWGRCTEAAFWCLELVDSGLSHMAEEALRWAWLYGYCLSLPHWISREDDLLQRTIALCRCPKKDMSILAILGTSLTKCPDRVNVGVRASGSPLITKALQQGKARTAWAYLLASSPSPASKDLQEPLQTIHGELGQQWYEFMQKESELGYLPPTAILAALVAFCCLGPEEAQKRWSSCAAPAPIPQEVQEAIEEWKAALGRRARRAFSIPQDCLFWATARGRDLTVYETNEAELLGCPDRCAPFRDSEPWKRRAEAYGGWDAVQTDDDARESFYDTEFPDDIPDEWSRAERDKSHGTGRARKGMTLGTAAVRWIRTWFGTAAAGPASAAVVWDGFETACRELEKRWTGTGPASLRDMWTTELVSAVAAAAATWDMEPIRRVIVSKEELAAK